MDNKRTSNSVLKECRYAENCYRKNPNHFSEFSHKHLDEIFEKGQNSSGNYEIPDELSYSKVIVLEQLKIMEELNPIKKEEPPKKIQKIKELFGTSSEDDDVEFVMEVNNANPKKTGECSKIPDQSVKQKISTSIKDFFKERAEKEKKKFLKVKKDETTKSPTPSRSSSSVSTPSKSVNKPGTSSTPPNRPSTSSISTPSRTSLKSNLEKKQEMNVDLEKFFPVKPQRGKMAQRLKDAAPYNFFLTTVTAAKETHSEPLSITFQDLLDDSLGKLASSVQINFMVDIGWLFANYCNTGNGDLPLLILYGDESPELRTIQSKKPNITAVKVQINTPIGVHHTKMMLFEYIDNSIRLVISTANAYEDDWHNRVQGLWISDKLPQLPESASFNDGESETGFREDLLRYLVTYNLPKLQPYIAKIRKTDFSKVKVFFVASSPGSHREIAKKGQPFGHPRLGKLLSQYSAKIDENCQIVAQCSSIGNLGPNAQSYLLSELAISFRRDSAPVGIRKVPQLKLVYPSFSNVKSSHDGMMGGGCLPYGKAANDKQPWLTSHLCQWKAESRNRNRSMPHIKTYARWSNEGLYWFCLTSANLSKSAWGTFNKSAKLEAILRINSYEAGVLFIPQIMIGKKCFPMKESQRQGNDPIFPMPYDVPLTPYSSDDTPFCMDYLHEYLKTYRP